jgi:hypothetical protein
MTQYCASGIPIACMILAGSVYADLGPRPPEAGGLWFALLIQSPISSGTEYDHRFHVEIPPSLLGLDAPQIMLEVRMAESHTVKCQVPFKPFSDGKLRRAASSGLNLAEIEPLHSLPPGTYLAALVADGKRCSNVCPFTIDPFLNEFELPVLDLVALEAPPYRHLPWLGLRVCLPEDPPEDLRPSNLAFVPLLVDGIERIKTLQIFAGGRGRWRAGARYLYILDAEGYRKPKVEARDTHEVSINAAGFGTGPIVVGKETPLGTAWDRN